jgi:predicted Fe-Mo cluster-binding NifX family protein
MQVVVTANTADLDGPASPVFGRCPMFLFVDTDSLEFEAVANPALDLPGGAGIEAARFVTDSGAGAVITGKVGPKAMDVLRGAGVSVHEFEGGSARQAVEAFKAAGAGPEESGEERPQAKAMKDSVRIAFSAENDRGMDSVVSHHFGRCPYFVLADVESGAQKRITTVENPFFGNHQPGQVPRFLRSQGADVIISGGMGWRAIEFFRAEAIEAVTGASGTAGEMLDAYLAGRLKGAGPCEDSRSHAHGSGHGHGHGCGRS